MEIFKRATLRMLIYFRLYPHIYFTFNPFKIYEFKELLKGLKFSGEEAILDIGCGVGLQTMLIGKRCKKVIGIDISGKAIAAAKSISHYANKRINSEFYCIRIENAGFENESFDKIFSFCVLEHISNYVEVLREAHRILKKDGQMIFSVDAMETIQDSKLLEKHKTQHFVEQYFKKEELRAALEEIGFKRIEIYPIFKSKYSKKLFIEGINNNAHTSFLYSIFSYGLIKYKEYQCAGENKGLFLIVKCSR